MARVPRIAASIGLGTWLGQSLIRFWQLLILGAAILGGTLQYLGPPPPPIRAVVLVPATPGQPEAPKEAYGPPPPPVVQPIVITPTPEPIAELLEPAPGLPDARLPRIGPEGQTPRQAYAIPFDREDKRPRIGLVVVGIGLNGTDSEDAIRSLPPSVTMGFSPYANRAADLVAMARKRGHELILSLPLEPRDAPLNDAGNAALLVSAPAEQNERRLQWSLSRMEGYVGVIGALGRLRGERFSQSGEPMRLMLQSIATRGLMYIDPRPGVGQIPLAWGRAIDMIIDESPLREDIETRLRELEELARERGNVLAIASAPLPITVGRIATWAATLPERGFVLAPVSVLANEPDLSPPPVRPVPPHYPSESRLDRQERVR